MFARKAVRVMRLVALSLLAAGCVPVPQSADAAQADAFVSRECTWSEPPTGTACDGWGFQECQEWAAVTVQSSALIAFSVCTSEHCVAAHDCSSSDCTCGSEGACAAGSACAVRPGQSVPSCIACVR
jgi:hypothetical protein